MNIPSVGSKSSLYTQLVHVEKTTGKTPSVLESFRKLTPPTELMYLYAYFKDFYNGDQFSYTELNAWQCYLGVTLSYRESEIIRQLCLERSVFDAERMAQKVQSETPKKGKRV